MKSRTTIEFWDCFEALPAGIQRVAKRENAQFRRDPLHPSLHFKQLYGIFWSIRAALHFRALGLRESDVNGEATVIWIWIGPNGEYERLIRNVRA